HYTWVVATALEILPAGRRICHHCRFPRKEIISMKLAITTRAATLFLAMLIAGCMNGFNNVQGSGISKTETRTVEAFHAVRLNGAADVSITIGQPVQVTVSGDDNIVPIIETDVHDGTLVIGHHESYNTKIGVKVAIVTPTLDAYELNGSGNVTIK